MAKLLLKHEGLTIGTYPLDNDSVSIGRNPESEIYLDDPAVSSEHARISRTPNEYLDGHFDYHIEDLDSTNGTKLNRRRINRELLKHGDAIQIGSHLFLFDSGQVQDLETTAIYLPDED